MKGSAITGPVGKEAAELWPVLLTILPTEQASANKRPAYRKQLGRRDVRMGTIHEHGSAYKWRWAVMAQRDHERILTAQTNEIHANAGAFASYFSVRDGGCRILCSVVRWCRAKTY